MLDEHYINPKLAQVYDIDSPWSADRDFYLSLAGTARKTILDLGCGTGLLCNAYAERGHDVTGVDPSFAMLEVARNKQYADKIEWIQSMAQDFQSGKLFDLIIMTGHAFQVLLEDEDVLKAMAAMQRHLKQDGLIVFESRNPAIDWTKQWNYDMVLELSGRSVTESRRFTSRAGERMSFELQYRFPDETLTSRSELRFMTQAEVVDCLQRSRLRLERLLGDWEGGAFDEETSEEMIFFARSL